MYASNEDEFNGLEGEWVDLGQTPPINDSIQKITSFIDYEQLNSDSSSRSNSSASKSDRSGSVSSICSIEPEPLRDNALIEEQENAQAIADPIPIYHINNDNDTSDDLLVTGETKEEYLPFETSIKSDLGNETTPIVNEYDLFNGECELSGSTLSLHNMHENSLVPVQRLVEENPISGEHDIVPVVPLCVSRRRKKILVLYSIVFLILMLQFSLIGVILSQRVTIKKAMEELEKANQRLDEMQIVPIEEVELRLAKQFDEKLEHFVDRKAREFEIEKQSFIAQIYELHEMVKNTNGNLNNTFQQLNEENEQLRQQLTELEHRLQANVDRSSKGVDSCPVEDDGLQSSESSIDTLLSSLITRTTSMAENTSINLSSIFETLSTTLVDLADKRHEYVEQSLLKLANISSSKTAEQIQTALRRGAEHISSSFREAQLSYASWMQTRAEQREQARSDSGEQEKKRNTERHPWRWTFQRGYDREKLRHQISPTKVHSTKPEYVCHTSFKATYYPFAFMKSWAEKVFRP